MWTLLHNRTDGSFVVLLNGQPYHVTPSDPLFPEVAAAAAQATLEPEPVPEAPPFSFPTLSRAQLLLALLLEFGVDETDVDVMIAQISNPFERDVARIRWRNSTSYERNHPLVEQIGSALGKSAAEIDTAWTQALTL